MFLFVEMKDRTLLLFLGLLENFPDLGSRRWLKFLNLLNWRVNKLKFLAHRIEKAFYLQMICKTSRTCRNNYHYFYLQPRDGSSLNKNQNRYFGLRTWNNYCCIVKYFDFRLIQNHKELLKKWKFMLSLKSILKISFYSSN